MRKAPAADMFSIYKLLLIFLLSIDLQSDNKVNNDNLCKADGFPNYMLSSNSSYSIF